MLINRWPLLYRKHPESSRVQSDWWLWSVIPDALDLPLEGGMAHPAPSGEDTTNWLPCHAGVDLSLDTLPDFTVWCCRCPIHHGRRRLLGNCHNVYLLYLLTNGTVWCWWHHEIDFDSSQNCPLQQRIVNIAQKHLNHKTTTLIIITIIIIKQFVTRTKSMNKTLNLFLGVVSCITLRKAPCCISSGKRSLER